MENFKNKRIVECEDCGALRNIQTSPECVMCNIPKDSIDRKVQPKHYKPQYAKKK